MRSVAMMALAAFGYLARSPEPAPTRTRAAARAGLGATWFNRVKSRCNNLEALQLMVHDPPHHPIVFHLAKLLDQHLL